MSRKKNVYNQAKRGVKRYKKAKARKKERQSGHFCRCGHDPGGGGCQPEKHWAAGAGGGQYSGCL